MAWDSKSARRRQNSTASRSSQGLGIHARQQSRQVVQPKSAHVSDPFLLDFLSPSFDAAAYLNSTLPSLQTSSSPSASTSASTKTPMLLADLSMHAQSSLSQLNAHTTRLTNTLTQLTDDILRSGSRLAYEVELLRGETLGLSEALTEGLQDDIAKFVPGGIQETTAEAPVSTAHQRRLSVVASSVPAVTADAAVAAAAAGVSKTAVAPEEPSYISQLRTLTLVRSRLDSVIKTFGDAMEFVFPPSEVSVSSSFLSVSAPDAGGDNHSTEEKGQQVLKTLRDEIAALLKGPDPIKGIEEAARRIEELKDLSVVWKGTAEEKGRAKFIESLARMVEERHRDLLREVEPSSRKDGARPEADNSSRKGGSEADAQAESRSGYGGYVRKATLSFVVLVLSFCFLLVLIRANVTSHHLSAVSHWAKLSTLSAWEKSAALELSDLGVPINKTWLRPKFHVLVDGRAGDASLCRTLLSAAALGYPPPILVGRRDQDVSLDLAELWKSALAMMEGSRSHIGQEDLVLWLGRASWLQLPAEILVRRYLQHKDAIDERLRREYGAGIQQRLLFAAAKDASGAGLNDTEKGILPGSTLPRNLYGSTMEESLVETRFLRPRFIVPQVFMGQAKDVTRFWAAGLEAMASLPDGADETSIGTRLFVNQERNRRALISGDEPLWPGYLSQLLLTKAALNQNQTVNQTNPIDLGIQLDYESRLFQPVDSTTTSDIHMLTFDRPILARHPPSSRSGRAASHDNDQPLRLPPELHPNYSALTTQQHPGVEERGVTWSQIPLLTNIAVPGSSIPAVLTLSRPEGNNTEEFINNWWARMWFIPHARTLLDKYIRPDRKALAEDVARDGGGSWWDMRGGRGGVWDDFGGWTPWRSVCSPDFDGILFGEESRKGEDDGMVEPVRSEGTQEAAGLQDTDEKLRGN
ncbi:hypothetical protein QBC47DRAFT_356454 [Echria macrotheca]|uniref:Uncharacterized protein n=1 Tax=Echria macrotheca TaxID=438768 RepID=A0AAJ0FHS1_9PEZI|nr:hypothetical protein QBC47DRAFT_356454 [Echria macrotheca]